MRRFMFVTAIGAFLAGSAFAQTSPEPAPAPQPTTPPATAAPIAPTAPRTPAAAAMDRSLKGEARVHYLAKRLNFTPEQKTTFDSLLEVYRQTLQEEQANLATILYEIRARVAEVQELERQGKQEEAAAARREIEKLRPGKQAEQELTTNLRSILTPAQLEDYDFLVDRMDRNRATIPLSPLDVVEAATYAGVDGEQKSRLSKLENDFRERINASGAVDREKVLGEFIQNVRDILKPDQQKKFDRRIEICRPEQLFVASGNPVEHIGKPVPKENVVRPLEPETDPAASNPK